MRSGRRTGSAIGSSTPSGSGYPSRMDDTAPTTAFRPRYLQHGRTNPLLLTPLQSYGLFAALLLSSSAVLVALRSEEHTSELQSQSNLVCRLLLEKKKKHN